MRACNFNKEIVVTLSGFDIESPRRSDRASLIKVNCQTRFPAEGSFLMTLSQNEIIETEFLDA